MTESKVMLKWNSVTNPGISIKATYSSGEAKESRRKKEGKGGKHSESGWEGENQIR